MPNPSGQFKSIQSILKQVHAEAAKKEQVLEELPPAAGPTEEELRELVAQFRARVERSPRVQRLVNKYRRRGFYAIRPWHWASLGVGLVLAFTIIPTVTVFFSTRARIERKIEEARGAARRGAHDEADRLIREAIAKPLEAPPERVYAAVADAYREGGDSEGVARAASLYDAASTSSPWEPIYLVRAAEMKLLLGRDDAETTVQVALERFPRALDVLLMAGRVALERGNYAVAEEHLRDLVNRDPANILARFYLLKAYQGAKDSSAARREEQYLLTANLREVQDVGILEALAEIYIRAGRRDEARRLLERLISDRGESAAAVSPTVFRTLARLAIAAADLRAAEDYLTSAIRRAPDEAEAYVMRGEVRYALGDLRESASDFRTALEIDPRYPRARYNLGNILFYDLDDLEAAEIEFEAAREAGFDEPILLYNIGAVHYMRGEFGPALASFSALPEAYARHSEVEWAAASCRLAAGETAAARVILRNAALRRKEPRAYNNYAVALEAAGETVPALRVLFNAVRLARTPEEADPKVRGNLQRIIAGGALDVGRDLHLQIERRIIVGARRPDGASETP